MNSPLTLPHMSIHSWICFWCIFSSWGGLFFQLFFFSSCYQLLKCVESIPIGPHKRLKSVSTPIGPFKALLLVHTKGSNLWALPLVATDLRHWERCSVLINTEQAVDKCCSSSNRSKHKVKMKTSVQNWWIQDCWWLFSGWSVIWNMLFLKWNIYLSDDGEV